MPHDSDSGRKSDGLRTRRRTFLGAMGAAGAGGLAGRGAAQEAPDSSEGTDQDTGSNRDGRGPPDRGFADRVVVNAKIATLDEHEMNDDPGTIAEAAAIEDARFRAVGDNEEIAEHVGPETEVIDAGGKTVIPGIVESHVHPSNTIEDVAPELFEIPGLHMALQAERTPEETLDKMEEFVNEVDPEEGEWIFMNVNPNPEYEETDSIIKLTRWVKRNDPVEELEINKNDVNDISPSGIPMLASISGGRTPSIADDGQIIRVTLEDGEPEREYIRGEP